MSCCGKSIPDRIAHGAVGLASYATGQRLAPSPVIAERRATCAACEHNWAGFCVICKCIIAAKTSQAVEDCSMWNPVAEK